MLIKGATQEQLTKALETVNKRFDGNIQFNRFDHAGRTRDGKEKFNVTLRVESSKGKGARRSQNGHRRMINACWHVHGFFFDALPKGTEIKSGPYNLHPGDPWHDRNIGSQIEPLYYSEACDCDIRITHRVTVIHD